MADNIPLGQWSASDAVDRLRVAIERHQAVTERQTATTRWLNVVMTALTILMAIPPSFRFGALLPLKFGRSFVSGGPGSCGADALAANDGVKGRGQSGRPRRA